MFEFQFKISRTMPKKENNQADSYPQIIVRINPETKKKIELIGKQEKRPTIINTVAVMLEEYADIKAILVNPSVFIYRDFEIGDTKISIKPSGEENLLMTLTQGDVVIDTVIEKESKDGVLKIIANFLFFTSTMS